MWFRSKHFIAIIATIGTQRSMRIFSVSDIHSDFPDNWKWITEDGFLYGESTKNDILIVAGDVATVVTRIMDTLRYFVAR